MELRLRKILRRHNQREKAAKTAGCKQFVRSWFFFPLFIASRWLACVWASLEYIPSYTVPVTDFTYRCDRRHISKFKRGGRGPGSSCLRGRNVKRVQIATRCLGILAWEWDSADMRLMTQMVKIVFRLCGIELIVIGWLSREWEKATGLHRGVERV